MNPQTGDAFVQRIKKGDSVSFIGILEWIHGLYHSYDTILVYVDNARWHKSKIVQLYQSLRPRIVLEYIPRYSPDLNPVEWEWHELRRVTTHMCYLAFVLTVHDTRGGKSKEGTSEPVPSKVAC